MTGYAAVQSGAAPATGAGEAKPAPAGGLGLEIRSVNSRFLDLAFRLPEELRQHEPALRELLGNQLKRGKVEVRISIEHGSAGPLTEPSPRLLQRLGSVQDNVRAWLPDALPLRVVDVLRMAATEQSAPHDWAPEVIPLAARALKELMLARKREGARLATVLLERIGEIRALSQQAVPLVPQLVAQQRQRFLERWNEAMAFAIRIDVAEEITRLGSHLDELERLIRQGGEIGKRLDFLIQELHREANTMGAKSAALTLTHLSVDMKVLIEQMREQVQNIE
jgi:uncharacterized protein (TIGR00255 family)